MYKPDYSLTVKNVERLNGLLEHSTDALEEAAFALHLAIVTDGVRDSCGELLPQEEQEEHTKKAMYALQCCRATMEMMSNGEARAYENEQVMDALTNDGTVA